MSPLPAILALLTGMAGWFYLFFSRAAHGLAGIEEDRLNRRRTLLRRVGGAVMLLLAVGFYLGFYAADSAVHPRLFVGVWLGVMLLLAAVVLLALVDVGLTVRLRRHRRRIRPPDAPGGPDRAEAGRPATDHRGPDRDRPPPP